MNNVEERLQAVLDQIRRAAEQAGRDAGSVRLVAVSKTKPAELIRRAYAAGQRDFGENYVQELVAKACELADLKELRWHLIGHLQRNKARQIVNQVSLIHSVDSARLVAELGRRAGREPLPEARRVPVAGQSDARLPVLIELNLAGETQKSGCSTGEAAALCDAVDAEPALRLAGLMTVPPYNDDPEASRPFFEQLARLRAELGGVERLAELSMGMSHDLTQAVESGATIVRVGTAIFGERARKLVP